MISMSKRIAGVLVLVAGGSILTTGGGPSSDRFRFALSGWFTALQKMLSFTNWRARIMTIHLTAPHFTPRILLTCAFGLGIPHSAVLSNMELFARDLCPPSAKWKGAHKQTRVSPWKIVPPRWAVARVAP
jgi:hypothetical protein